MTLAKNMLAFGTKTGLYQYFTTCYIVGFKCWWHTLIVSVRSPFTPCAVVSPFQEAGTLRYLFVLLEWQTFSWPMTLNITHYHNKSRWFHTKRKTQKVTVNYLLCHEPACYNKDVIDILKNMTKVWLKPWNL